MTASAKPKTCNKGNTTVIERRIELTRAELQAALFEGLINACDHGELTYLHKGEHDSYRIEGSVNLDAMAGFIFERHSKPAPKWEPSRSYPYLSIARQFGLPYGDVLEFANDPEARAHMRQQVTSPEHASKLTAAMIAAALAWIDGIEMVGAPWWQR